MPNALRLPHLSPQSFDENSLHASYDLVNLSISPGTQISTRTDSVRELLESSGSGNNDRTPLVVLTAPAKAASKLISVTEIVKRDLLSRGIKVFQYNALHSKMLQIPRHSSKSPPGQDDAEQAEHAFEIMGAQDDNGLKKRSVPVMTIYLSKVSVKGLKTAYG